MIQEIDSLKATKVATVQAFQKEEELEENYANYCLNLEKADSADVSLFEDLKEKLFKPRSAATAI